MFSYVNGTFISANLLVLLLNGLRCAGGWKGNTGLESCEVLDNPLWIWAFEVLIAHIQC